ncbi:reverse transcriptase domain-containing protein [Tanacetum coccineum]
MDSILDDSVDKNSPNDNLVDTISEMFIDEHALDYSSPPLWVIMRCILFDLRPLIDNTYDDPFDSEEEKIKDSKISIDELDPPGSSDFLLFPECDSVFYEDFSVVDALPSTNNEDKDFNPLLYELPFHKEVPRSETLLSFSSENEEKVFNPGILTFKRVHTFLLPELSHRGTKAFKVIKIFESPMEIFPFSYGENIPHLDVPLGKFTFPVDIVIADYDVDTRVPFILGRPFLRTARALVDVHEEELTLRVGDEKLVFNVESTSKYPHKHGDESINQIDIIDTTCKDHFHEVLNVQKSIHPLSGSPTPSDPVVASLSPSLTPFGDNGFLLQVTRNYF